MNTRMASLLHSAAPLPRQEWSKHGGSSFARDSHHTLYAMGRCPRIPASLVSPTPGSLIGRDVLYEEQDTSEASGTSATHETELMRCQDGRP